MAVLNYLVEWFLNSPIYKNGAYLEYYSSGNRGPAYPEITAYAISLSCILYKEKNEKRFLDRAEACARYMISINRDGAVPCLTDNLLYAFDTGIFISSMFDLYTLNKRDQYLDQAQKSLDWLYSLWDGKSFDAVDKVPVKKEWYHFRSVHLAKLVIPLLKASKYLESEKHESTALKLLDNYKQLQTSEGSFRVNEDSDIVMIHPHCYATEAFLYAYCFSKRNEFLEIARKSSDWLSKIQNADGSFYRCYDGKGGNEDRNAKAEQKTSDAAAQATRIWNFLGANQTGIEKAYKYLNSELKNNGLRLIKNSSFKNRLFSRQRAVYSWPTFFYIHSLMLPFGHINKCKDIF
jgi:hypothetical protein